MTEASRSLVALAKRVAAGYVAQTGPRAILLTGSAAEGLSDFFSDLDLIAYYDRLPSPDDLAAARASLPATDIRAGSGQETDSFLEEYVLQGVQVQVAHLTIAAWERDMAPVLEEFEPATLVEKALTGLLDGVALHGGDLIEGWQARAAAYPGGLAPATVEHYLRFFPLWLVGERWRTRDASIFYHQMLVETSLNLLGVLAGLNHMYFSSFQFKRLHRFVDTMDLAPERLADRLDGMFALDPVDAGIAMERLVDETVALVETHMPAVDTAPARRHLGVRHQPWHPPAEPARAGS
ncbi:MAG: hypothetical protein KY456_04735 [Chloroflexi bacterium]|nr:hypothetical protein [Chloroflexota bacterium]